MSDLLERVLSRTGFVDAGRGDMPGLFRHAVGNPHLEAAFSPRAGLQADAVYETDDGAKLIVKETGAGEAGEMHERAWNLGLAPLLWIVTPYEVRVYDAFRGVGTEEDRGPVATYRTDVKAEMAALDEFCGRFSLDTGTFWASGLAKGIHRAGKVDQVLLQEIQSLEQRLVEVSVAQPGGMRMAEARGACQELVTATLFASYVTDRGDIATPFDGFHRLGDVGLAELFRSRSSALALFDWLHETFNGDVFPQGMGESLRDEHLPLLEDFARGTSLRKRDAGQMRLFRFRFDTVPIELISAVYEAFARRAASDMARELGLHYTPVELVHMALDPVFEDLDGKARILDPTCGSGLFLVQALRRLAWKRCGDGPRPRSVVRDILYRQVHGRIDLQVVFAEWLRPEEYYFGVECKRLRPGDSGTFRYYVDAGVGKFADGTYAPGHPSGMLVGYLMADAEGAVTDELSRRVSSKYPGAVPLNGWPDKSYRDADIVAGDVPRAAGQPINILHTVVRMHG